MAAKFIEFDNGFLRVDQIQAVYSYSQYRTDHRTRYYFKVEMINQSKFISEYFNEEHERDGAIVQFMNDLERL